MKDLCQGSSQGKTSLCPPGSQEVSKTFMQTSFIWVLQICTIEHLAFETKYANNHLSYNSILILVIDNHSTQGFSFSFLSAKIHWVRLFTEIEKRRKRSISGLYHFVVHLCVALPVPCRSLTPPPPRKVQLLPGREIHLQRSHTSWLYITVM